MATIETIVNNALEMVGHPRRIGNILEGSITSQIALDAWGLTRDALLYELEPDWAVRDAPMTLIKEAPNIAGSHANYPDGIWTDEYPILPWLYEYAMPDDVIKPLQIKVPTYLVPVWRPRYIPFRFTVHSDTETILTDARDAILTYIKRVTPTDSWANDFTDAMIMRLAKVFQGTLGKRMPKEEGDGDSDRAG